MGLNTQLVWIYIGIGVIANVITGLLRPLLKAMWTKINKPAPLTLAGKVQLAQQIEMQEQTLARINHMAANPRDLYFHLFEMATVMFLCITGAECLFIWRLRQDVPIRLVLPAGLVLFVLGLALGVGVMFELHRLSVKNIERTRSALQKNIDDAKSKLNLPSV